MDQLTRLERAIVNFAQAVLEEPNGVSESTFYELAALHTAANVAGKTDLYWALDDICKRVKAVADRYFLPEPVQTPGREE